MPRRRKRISWPVRIALAILAIPGLYLLAALIGALIPVNADWQEPDEGVTIYVADNGIHADLVLPANAQGLDWRPLLPKSQFRNVPAGAEWIAFGAGERRVYLDTPTWWDLTPRTAWAGLTGGDRVMHVQWVANPAHSARVIRLSPEQYRRLWASIRSEFDLGPDSEPVRIDHPGYGMGDAFYHGIGQANAINTCNQWSANRLRVAGVKTPLWTPFVQGLVSYYRRVGQST